MGVLIAGWVAVNLAALWWVRRRFASCAFGWNSAPWLPVALLVALGVGVLLAEARSGPLPVWAPAVLWPPALMLPVWAARHRRRFPRWAPLTRSQSLILLACLPLPLMLLLSVGWTSGITLLLVPTLAAGLVPWLGRPHAPEFPATDCGQAWWPRTPGWYPDGSARKWMRFWDGSKWLDGFERGRRVRKAIAWRWTLATGALMALAGAGWCLHAVGDTPAVLGDRGAGWLGAGGLWLCWVVLVSASAAGALTAWFSVARVLPSDASFPPARPPIAAAVPGWLMDPDDPGTARYWDGRAWTEHTVPGPASGELVPGLPSHALRREPQWFSAWTAIAAGSFLLVIYVVSQSIRRSWLAFPDWMSDWVFTPILLLAPVVALAGLAGVVFPRRSTRTWVPMVGTGLIGVSCLLLTLMVPLPTDPDAGGLAWSPDSTRVAVERTSGVWLLDASGTGAPRRIAAEADSDLGTPAWSPDGRQVAFVDDSALLVTAVGGGAARRLSRADSDPDGAPPMWSPDGSRLLYAVDDWTSGDGELESRQLWVLGADGSRVRVADGEGLSGIGWSPTGNRIAFCTDLLEDGGVWVVPADGSGTRTGDSRESMSTAARRFGCCEGWSTTRRSRPMAPASPP